MERCRDAMLTDFLYIDFCCFSMQFPSLSSHVPGLGCLVRKPALLASIRAIVGTVTSTHLAENLLRGDLDEIQGGRRGSPPYI